MNAISRAMPVLPAFGAHSAFGPASISEYAEILIPDPHKGLIMQIPDDEIIRTRAYAPSNASIGKYPDIRYSGPAKII